MEAVLSVWEAARAGWRRIQHAYPTSLTERTHMYADVSYDSRLSDTGHGLELNWVLNIKYGSE